MYFAYQEAGLLFEATRADGLSFHSEKLPAVVGCNFASQITNSIKSVLSGLRHWLPGTSN